MKQVGYAIFVANNPGAVTLEIKIWYDTKKSQIIVILIVVNALNRFLNFVLVG